ncbi:hypothetical protein [uncultured Roseobacter sp.]|uniref:hypothetical protein n=1 Tax=uncultured Roseobacter sp. TaxID=114847 RepID=UPI002621EB55|nr:hypothetical protein [uncultured Roseobacter sp.]
MTGYIALLAWPVLALTMFRKYSDTIAIALTVIAGYLLLPETIGIDPPLIPEYNKTSAAALAALAVAISAGQGQGVRPGWLPAHPLLKIAFIAVFVGIFMTVITNGDTLRYGANRYQAMRPYDAFSNLLAVAIALIPFLLGRRFLAHPDQHLTLLKILCLAALGYSLLALYEVRMSPQINRMVYGFFPHSWAQHYRAGGWRPLVFLEHGLFLGIFLCCAVLGAAAWMRQATGQLKTQLIGMIGWLFMTLFLSKTLGAFLICIVLLPVVLLLSVRLQMLASLIIVLTILTYPVLRGGGVIPTERLTNIAEQINPTRASSLEFRLVREEQFLERVNSRPVFGWGSYGRNRVVDEATGRQTTIDGTWIILITANGWVGYLGRFGLLVLPVVLLFRRSTSWQLTQATSGLCIMLAANMVDLIPNSGLTPVTWLIAGALAGRLELGKITDEADDTDESEDTGRRRYQRADTGPRNARPVYTRQKTPHARTRPQTRTTTRKKP